MKFNQDKASNVYLSKLEKWDEAQVGNYSRKVKAQTAFPWLKALLLLGIYGAFTGALWLANLFLCSFGIAESVFALVSSEICTIALGAGFTLISIIAAIVDGKKNTAKFVSDNNGEVGHRGGLYAKKIKSGACAAFFLTLITLLAVPVLAFLFATGGDFSRFGLNAALENFFTMDIFGSMLFVPTALIYAYVYSLAASSTLKSIGSDLCPVCGRSDYRFVKRAGDTEETAAGRLGYVYGQYKLDSAKASSSEGVTTYCKYCSFFVKGNGTETLK